jgi:hypothetical protein
MKDDSYQLNPQLCSERASCRRILATIIVVPSDPSTAGTLRSPAVFDSYRSQAKTLRFYLTTQDD